MYRLPGLDEHLNSRRHSINAVCTICELSRVSIGSFGDDWEGSEVYPYFAGNTLPGNAGSTTTTSSRATVWLLERSIHTAAVVWIPRRILGRLIEWLQPLLSPLVPLVWSIEHRSPSHRNSFCTRTTTTIYIGSSTSCAVGR